MKYLTGRGVILSLVLYMGIPVNAQFNLDKKTSLKLAPALAGISMTLYLIKQTDLGWSRFNKGGCMSALGQTYTLMMTARRLAPALAGCAVSALLFKKV